MQNNIAILLLPTKSFTSMKNFPKCKIWKVDDERIQQEKFHGNTCLLSSHSLALSLDPLTQDELRCIAVSLINPNFSHIYFPFPVLCNCEVDRKALLPYEVDYQTMIFSSSLWNNY